MFRRNAKLCLLVTTSVTQSTLSPFAASAIQAAAQYADTGPERQMPTERNGLVSGA
jgi:hypothetical protein